MLRISLAVAAVGVAGAATLGLWQEHTTEFELSNGMKVLVLERPSSSTVALTLLANAGWSDDPVGRRGTGRVLERMVEEGGLAFGSKNLAEERKAMATAEELADKWEAELAKPQADELVAARLKVEAERAAGFVTTLSTPGAFRAQLERAGGNLLRSRVDATQTTITATMPGSQAEVWFEGMAAWLKEPAWRNFYQHRSRVGSAAQNLGEQTALLSGLAAKAFPKHAWAATDVAPEDLAKIRIRDVAAFHREAFAPGNVVLTVVGSMPAAAVRALAEKHFGPLAARPAMKHNWDNVDQTPFPMPQGRAGVQVLALGYRRSPADSPDDSALDVAAHLLFNGPDSLLNQKLVKNLKAASISGAVSFPASTGGGLLCVIGVPAPGQTYEQLTEEIQMVLDGLATQPPAPEALLAGKRRYIASAVRLLEEDDTAAELLGRVVSVYGSSKGLARVFNELEAVSPQDIARVAKQYLSAENRVAFTWTGGRL